MLSVRYSIRPYCMHAVSEVQYIRPYCMLSVRYSIRPYCMHAVSEV